MEADKLKNEAVSAPGTHELAKIDNRFVALVIDSIMLGVISSILGAITSSGQAGFVTYFLLQTAYQWYFLLYRDGQTPGKKIMHIRVVKVDGTPLTGADATLRSIGYFINNFVFGLFWLWAPFDSNYQGIHDKLAKTYVVKE